MGKAGGYLETWKMEWYYIHEIFAQFSLVKKKIRFHYATLKGQYYVLLSQHFSALHKWGIILTIYANGTTYWPAYSYSTLFSSCASFPTFFQETPWQIPFPLQPPFLQLHPGSHSAFVDLSFNPDEHNIN